MGQIHEQKGVQRTESRIPVQRRNAASHLEVVLEKDGNAPSFLLRADEAIKPAVVKQALPHGVEEALSSRIAPRVRPEGHAGPDQPLQFPIPMPSHEIGPKEPEGEGGSVEVHAHRAEEIADGRVAQHKARYSLPQEQQGQKIALPLGTHHGAAQFKALPVTLPKRGRETEQP